MVALARETTFGDAIVGRSDEVALLDRLVADLRSGRGAAVAFTGDPGIGKTTLLGALNVRARAADLPALVGWGERLGPGGVSTRDLSELDRLTGSGTAVGTAGAGVLILDEVHRLPAGWASIVEKLIGMTASGSLLLALAYRPRHRMRNRSLRPSPSQCSVRVLSTAGGNGWSL